MECPRCGENNLPGLPNCLGCGRPLLADHAAPVVTVPKVTTKNPLGQHYIAEGMSAAERGRRDLAFRFLTPRALLFFRAMFATLKGWLPGLGPFLRKEYPALRAFLAAWVILSILMALTWTSDANGWVMVGIQTLLITAGATEAYRVLPELRPAPRWVASAIFGWAGMALQMAVLFLIFNTWWMEVDIMYGTPTLPAGVYLGERNLRGGVEVGEFVVAADEAMELIAPVIAVAGQEVASERGQVWVDDKEVDVERLTRQVQPHRRATFVVPDGQVVLLNLDLEPRRISRLTGRIIWRWTPSQQRGNVPPVSVWRAGEDP